MTYQTNPYLLWQLIPAVITFGIGWYIQSRPRKKRESNVFSVLVIGGAIWAFANGVQWLSPNYSWQFFWNRVTYIGILIVPTGWFLLAAKFTGIWQEFIDRKMWVFWSIIGLFYLSILTNQVHKLFFQSQELRALDGFLTLTSTYGVLFYIHTYYSYVLLFLGVGLIAYVMCKNFEQYSNQAFGLLVGIVFPWIANAIYLLGYLPEDFPDPTPIAFSVTAIAFAWTIFPARLLEVVATGYDQLVHNLAIGVIVLDVNRVILDINAAAQTILEIPEGIYKGQAIVQLLAEHPKFLEVIAEDSAKLTNVEIEIPYLVQNQSKTLQLNLSGIQDDQGQFSGYLLQIRDISQIKQTEAELQETQELYITVLDTLPDSYFEADSAGLLTFANQSLVKNLGFARRDQVIGKHFRSFTYREVIREIYRRFRRVYDTKRPIEPFQYFYTRTDGEVRIAEMTVSPIMEGDEVVGSRGIIRDHTDRIKAENEVNRQKDLLDGVLQNAPLSIVVNNMQGKITSVNPAFETLFGYTSEEVLGKDLDNLLSTPEIYGEMRTVTHSSLQAAMRVNKIGKRKHKDGSLVDVELFSSPYYIGGEQYGYMIFYNDISEHLQAEADLARTQNTFISILETLQDSYFEADPTGIITNVNQAYLKALGYNRREDVIGKHFRHFTDRKSIRDVFTRFQQIYQTQQPIEPFVYFYRRQDGSSLISEISVSPIIDRDEVVGTRGIIRDITDRVRAAEKLAAINRVAVMVSSSLDLETILQAMGVELTRIFEIRNVGIALLTPDKTALEIVAFHTVVPDEESVVGLVLPLEGNEATAEAIRTQKPVVIDNAQSDKRVKALHDLYIARGTRAIMILPLMARGNVIGTIGMPALNPDHIFSAEEIELAETIANQIAAGIDNARLHAVTETALGVVERDLEIGRQIQGGFFPEKLPMIAGYEVQAYFEPARQVAGDFYDMFPIGDTQNFAVVIADVCDKGVGAALFMVLLRSLVRSYSEQYVHIETLDELLADIAAKVNNYIVHTHGRSNMFATMFMGILNPNEHKLYYVNGGQDPPLVIDASGAITAKIEPTGPAFGFMADIPFEIKVLNFSPGDLLIAFTDGITDAKNASGDFYTEERLYKLAAQPWASAFSIVKQLEGDVFSHIGNYQQFDDVTLIAVRRCFENQYPNHNFSQKAEIVYLPLFRRFVREACQLIGANDSVCKSFEVSVDEVCSNLILYGYEGMEVGDIYISVVGFPNEIVIQIEDTGHPFDPTQFPEPDLDETIDDRQIGGLGIYFVNEIIDEVNYTSQAGINCLTLRMKT